MNLSQLKQKNIIDLGGAVSGGLDSCTVIHWLNSQGMNVYGYTVDLGQPDEDSVDSVIQRMLTCGAVEAEIIEGKDELAKGGLKVIQSQARYEGGYWNTTGIARPITTAAILGRLKEKGIGIFFHGATGRGNDQVRFQLAANMIQPEIEVYAPWRDQEYLKQFPGRQQMLDYCEMNGLPIKSRSIARYSTDANFLGLTHEAGDLEDMSLPPTYVNPEMGVWAIDAPNESEVVSVRWEQGVPVSINGNKLVLAAAFQTANKIAGAHGIGIGAHVVENRYVGIKSRGLYEAPGMELLGTSYEYLLQLILDRRARELHDQLSKVLASQIYEGYWFDLATTSALAALEPITSLATGTITVQLHKGNILFDSATEVPHSLYTDDASMEAVGSYDHVDAEGFVKVLGVSSKNFGVRQRLKLD